VTAALAAEGIVVEFDGVRAVHGVSFAVGAGERRVIIGPNGAGKTTLFNAIAGQVSPSAGRILLFGADITRAPVHARARLGMGRTFQISRLFKTLTVAENVLIAARGPTPLSLAALRPSDADPALVGRTQALLAQWGLADESGERVQNISHGNQRLLEIVLALATGPRVVLLDEPTAGLAGTERDMVTARLKRLPRDVTVILTDHDMDVVFDLADRIMVLNQGEVVAEGAPDEIRRDPRVHEIYFGED
jgi:branched-chain amino acid transport system ATP-binding protein